MASTQTDACPYKSRFADGLWIAPAQYLAENMCDRIARSRKVVLTPYFWKQPGWERTFRVQLLKATSLLKLYPMAVILRALRTPSGKRAYSLAAPWLDELCRAEMERPVAEPTPPPPPAPAAPVEAEPPRPVFVTKPSPLSRLKGL